MVEEKNISQKDVKTTKVMNLLHMARKAGKLKLGFDACERSMFTGVSKLTIVAADVSEKTRQRLDDLTEDINIKKVEFGTKELFGSEFNIRNVAIISIEDKNFAKGLIKLFD